MAMNDAKQLWLSVAGKLYRREKLVEIIDQKGSVLEEIWSHLEPVRSNFIQVVIGQKPLTYIADATAAVCINRLISPNSVSSLPPNIRQELTRHITDVFTLGMMTQLSIFNMPSRPKCKLTNLTDVQREWELYVGAYDHLLKGHGDANSQFVLNIYEAYFEEHLRAFCKTHFKAGVFSIGKYQSFFRNIYFAGIALVMNCEIAGAKL